MEKDRVEGLYEQEELKQLESREFYNFTARGVKKTVIEWNKDGVPYSRKVLKFMLIADGMADYKPISITLWYPDASQSSDSDFIKDRITFKAALVALGVPIEKDGSFVAEDINEATAELQVRGYVKKNKTEVRDISWPAFGADVE